MTPCVMSRYERCARAHPLLLARSQSLPGNTCEQGTCFFFIVHHIAIFTEMAEYRGLGFVTAKPLLPSGRVPKTTRIFMAAYSPIDVVERATPRSGETMVDRNLPSSAVG